VYKDIQALKQLAGVFNNPYFIFLTGPFHNKKVSSNYTELLYAVAMCSEGFIYFSQRTTLSSICAWTAIAKKLRTVP